MSRILVVDDKDTMRSLFQRLLEGHDVITADDGAKALALLQTEDRFDVVVSDIRMPKVDGLTLLKEIKRVQPDAEVILMTAFAEVNTAVEAMKSGAFDYLVKPFDPDEAELVVQKALEVGRLREDARRLRQELDEARGFGPFVGTSPSMQKIYTLIDKAAASAVNVLIEGESGTGKELVARSIHERSVRNGKPFIAINCGALPTELAESELFGHVRGAFTGAATGKAGLFEEAAGGTVLLDEINSLPAALQVKLNRAIELREGRRVGSNQSYRIDVRLIAATNADLRHAVEDGTFREDLFFRLHVLLLRLPPLRARKEDIPLLTAHFLKQAGWDRNESGFTPAALKALLAYEWPGNVRELRNAVESAVAVTDTATIDVADLPAHIGPSGTGDIPSGHLARLTYQEVLELSRERILQPYLTALMQAFQGNVTNAAAQAGIERETLHRLLKKYSVDPSAYRG